MMKQQLKRDAPVLLTALAVCLLVSGCQRLRLPAIDPSGQRIFLPPPNSTTFVGPAGQGGLLPTPAFSTPATPPPCETSTRPAPWIDMRAAFPQSVVVAAGQQHTLTTTVTRLSNGAPLADWFVRYQLIGTDATATFEPEHSTTVDVTTNEAGQATATLVPQSDQHASAQVRIQVIQPAQATGQATEVAIAESSCTVTWSAPGLSVKVSGPESAGIDSVVTYQVEISNPGNVSVRDIVVSDESSAGLEVVSSQPTGTPFGERFEWRIAELPPQFLATIDVHCRVTERGMQRFCAAAAGGGLQAQSCRETQITVPAIGLVMRGPDQLELGQQAEFEVEITNEGDVPLTNVLLVDQYDAGLRHTSGQPSPIKKQIGEPIAPGKTAYIKLIYDTVRAGTSCHTLTVTADGGHRAEARSCVTITEPQVDARPEIEARITGPAKQTVGDVAEYRMEVRNTGNVPLTNVQIHFNFSPSLSPVQATDNHEWHQGGLIWRNRIPQLQPGESDSLRVRCKCLQADPTAEVGVVASSSENVTDSAKTQTQIAAPAKTAPAIPEKPEEPEEPKIEPDVEEPVTEPPVTGQLSLTVVDLDDSIQQDQTTTYVVTLKNDRNVADANVTVTFQISDGMELVRLRNQLQEKRVVSPDGRTIEVGPIKTLRAGEAYPAFRVTLKGNRPGVFPFRVRVRSQRTPAGIEEVEDTTVVE